MSNTIIPEEISSTIALGQNHGITDNMNNFKLVEYITETELVAANLEPDSINEFRNSVVDYLRNHLNTLKKDKPDIAINKVRRFLKENDKIIVTRSDKGQASVILDKIVYKTAGITMLSDMGTYLEAPNDNTIVVEKN